MQALLIVVAIFFVLSALVTVVELKSLRSARRIERTPTVRVADASGEGVVELAGRVLASEQGMAVSPFTGRHGVYVSSQVQEYRRSSKSGRWVTVFEEAERRPFWLDDGSGAHARIETDGGKLVFDEAEVAITELVRDLPPQLRQYVVVQAHEPSQYQGYRGDTRFVECVLQTGDPVYVLGSSRRTQGPPTPGAYRTRSSSQLLVFHG